MKLVKKGMIPYEFVCHLKIVLGERQPQIWREVLVPADFSLVKLHQVIQMSMGWTDSHLHEFEVEGVRYGHPMIDPDDLDLGYPRAKDEKRFKLADVLKEGMSFQYRYDFGDDWVHEIKVEAISEKRKDRIYPVCVAGSGACPPEDCGGFGGYEELLEQIRNPKHPEHESTLIWLGGQFDPNSFDANRVNRDWLWRKRWK